MTTRSPIDFDWLIAMAHPCRVQIVHHFLATGTTTPKDVADALAAPLGTVSYHVRVLTRTGVLRLTGRTRRRGASVRHYQLVDREHAASLLWGIRAALLVTDFERENGRGDITAALDREALEEWRHLTAGYLGRIGELALQTRERRNACAGERAQVTKVAVLLALDEAGETTTGEETV